MSLRRCSECQLVCVSGCCCEQCGDIVCDDCAFDHPCNWDYSTDLDDLAQQRIAELGVDQEKEDDYD